MICELANKLSNYIYWAMSYGDDNGKITPYTKVSIVDFAMVVGCAFALSVFIIWWWIPIVWIYQNIKWGRISNSLCKKRFKCKGR